MANFTSRNPADLFRLHSKGMIAEGFDADIVIWKETSGKVGEQILYSKGDLDIYLNEPMFGKADIVIKSGEIVYQNGKLIAELPQGHYLYRK